MLGSRGVPKSAGETGSRPPRHRFEAEVHLGILGIIFLLLFLNFASNFLILSTRSGRQKIVNAHFDRAMTTVGQELAHAEGATLRGDSRTNLMRQHQLSGLTVFGSAPADASSEERRLWFARLAQEVSPEQLPALAPQLLDHEFGGLHRGEGNEYFTARIADTPSGPRVVTLSRLEPELARLDDFWRLSLVMGIIALVATSAVYILLSKLIFSPFRRLKQEARQAGRHVDQNDDDVETLLEDYRRIIEELCEKERELIDLNAVISRHADSLEQFNRYLLGSMTSGLVAVDSSSIVRAVNPAACMMLGVQERAVVGTASGNVLPEGSLLRLALADALSGEGESEYRETTLNRGRDRLVLGVTASTVADGSGAKIGAVLLMHDITEVTHLREELEVRNRLAALGEMSGGLAHQLRNSLGAVNGYLSLLKRRLSRRGVEEGVVDDLVTETAQAEHLVRRFLEFARPLQADLEPISLRSLVRDCVESFRMRQDGGAIEVEVGEVPDVTFSGDHLMLKQALGNLIDNAANAYPPGTADADQVGNRSIRIEAARGAGVIQIGVADHGCGIPAENLARIFTPFYSSRPSGTGLGLPLVVKIIDLHGGHVDVQSEVGEGTRFTVTLPLASGCCLGSVKSTEACG